MLRNSLIALSAATAMGLGLAAPASAKTNFTINVDLGFGGGGGGFCHYEYLPYKKWNYWHTAYRIKFKKVLVCG